MLWSGRLISKSECEHDHITFSAHRFHIDMDSTVTSLSRGSSSISDNISDGEAITELHLLASGSIYLL
jgi:hypothetical protein